MRLEVFASHLKIIKRQDGFNILTGVRTAFIEAMPEGVSARMLERVTEAAFGQRRKMLRQSLKALPGAVEALDTLGIDPARRAETLSVAEFVTIARVLSGGS